AVSRVQSVIDDLRDQVAQKVMDAEPEEDEPEED
ncbi:TPA: terminase, partial [Klebsiella pneumoniae]|nr:terminase [Klebsiella pneumoniae]